MKDIVLLGAAVALAASATAGVHKIPLDTSDDRVESPLRVSLERIGTLAPRSVYDVKASNWTIVCETLDRYVDFFVKRVRNYTYRKNDGRLVQLFWSYGEGVPYWTRQPEIKPRAPGDSFETRPIVLVGNVKPLKDPVWVDLFTGRIYAFPKKDWIADADGVTYMNVPAYDSPCVLTERSVVMDLPAPTRPVLEVFEATRREAEAENAARRERSTLSDGVNSRTAADNLDI